MAFVHSGSEIRPTKLEIVNEWVPQQPWFAGEEPLTIVGAYRFDDPDGEVGIETHLARTSDGHLFQVPMTYRGAPLAGADDWLITTMEHTALGDRWIYDGCGDPVYAATLAATVLQGGTQAPVFRDVDGTPEQIEPSVRVQGSGQQSDIGSVGLVDIIDAGAVTIVETSVGAFEVRRTVDDAPASGPLVLTGTWSDQSSPVVLVAAETS